MQVIKLKCPDARVCIRAIVHVCHCVFIFVCICACAYECVCLRGNICSFACMCVSVRQNVHASLWGALGCVLICADVCVCQRARAHACVLMHVIASIILLSMSLQISRIH